MFKFDFEVDSENGDPFNTTIDCPHTRSQDVTTVSWYESQEILLTQEILDNMDIYSLNSIELRFGDVIISYMIPGFLLKDIRKNPDGSKDIAVAEENHSDLIPGIYEGGAKIWECTEDLLAYVYENSSIYNFENKRVLDLGCGAGLLGIYAYKCGGKVHFQDYNKDVLEKVTTPNVLLNAPLPSNSKDFDVQKWNETIKFYSGDWQKYAELTIDKFDMILTSETIYNPDNQQKLLDALYKKLADDGVILLIAKTYYFGVGGGLRQFEQLILDDKRFQSKVVWNSREGVSREILEIRKIIAGS